MLFSSNRSNDEMIDEMSHVMIRGERKRINIVFRDTTSDRDYRHKDDVGSCPCAL